ncbi:type II secretion system protein [Paucibacter sp. APW11]|uniref:Type II secretion system protein n=1 Tax=Roseateles aquae TaxID=3077235 RepID=A0ABU3PEF0_9BURK|nr:type II secretion system protein [Paucibacter sp. APW11]MDT9000914.1 type II secretion system protein [Paucibacter sp. APW11]
MAGSTPTGEAMRQRGFSYLGMLFFVAITAAALAALGQRWSTAMQRERERELEFRGKEIARAIESYLAATGTSVPQYPRSLDDLLIDGRSFKPRHHLRRRYLDPFTGTDDWVLVPAPSDPKGFAGVHSSSEQVLLRRLSADASKEALARDWQFLANASGQAIPDPGINPADIQASAPSAAH